MKATRLEGTDRVILLLECCDKQLRKDLTRNAGGTLTEMDEEEVLNAIKTLAIREENTMVARVVLHNMRQECDEPIHAFGARQAFANSHSVALVVRPVLTTLRQ